MDVLFFAWQVCVGLALALYGFCQYGNLKRLKELEERMAKAETDQKAQEQQSI